MSVWRQKLTAFLGLECLIDAGNGTSDDAVRCQCRFYHTILFKVSPLPPGPPSSNLTCLL